MVLTIQINIDGSTQFPTDHLDKKKEIYRYSITTRLKQKLLYLGLEHAFRPFKFPRKVEVGHLNPLQLPTEGRDVVHLLVLGDERVAIYAHVIVMFSTG